MPDYASTLITQAEQDANEDNLRFLQGELAGELAAIDSNATRISYESPPVYSVRRPNHGSGRRSAVIEERLGEILDQERSRWNRSRNEGEESQPPIWRQPSNYEPGYVEESDSSGDWHRHTMRLRRLRDHFQSQLDRSTAQQAETTSTPQRYPSRFTETGISPTSSELRTQAMIQSVRQSSEGSIQSRSQLQRYILDRQRRRNQEQETDEATGEDDSVSHLLPSQRRHMQQEMALRQQIVQNRNLHDEFQRHRTHLEEQLRQTEQSMAGLNSMESQRRRQTATPASPPSRMSLENTVRYLESLRLCESNDEGLEVAGDSGFDPEELNPHNVKDFLLDTNALPKLPPTSYLQPGCVLTGKQHAMPARSLAWNDYASHNRFRVRLPNLNTPSTRNVSPPTSTTPSTLNATQAPRSSSRVFLAGTDSADDSWPVKVTIHAVDLEEMTLSGTMEACDVPDKALPPKASNITTYLEGEILDFRKFTLETKSFKADSRVDGIYWRKLPPFRDMKDEEEVTRCLLSQEWVQRELMTNWVLMRWKG